MFIIALLILASFFGLITAHLAGQRGHDTMTWYVVGLLLGPLGLCASLLVRQRGERSATLS